MPTLLLPALVALLGSDVAAPVLPGAALAADTHAAAIEDTADTTLFGLPENVGPVDRVARVVVGAGLMGGGAAVVTWAQGQGGDASSSTAIGAAMMAVSAVPLLTGAVGTCPIYSLVGIDKSF